MTAPQAFYFGCRRRIGHYLHSVSGECSTYELPLDIPWTIWDMDGLLLKNGKHPDIYDGNVFWTCGGKSDLWFAFLWWDNSIDRRGASNSGFYVQGFAFGDHEKAFKFACEAFPDVVSRQRCQLTLQAR